MTISLVTGKAGTPHVTSGQMRELYKGFTGSACVLSSVGNYFWATVNSATSITIGTGAAIMADGGYVYNDGPVNLTISAGSASTKRIDIITIKRSVSGEIESAELYVHQGTPAASNPAAPSIASDEMALWKIPINGVNVGTPVQLYTSVSGFMYGDGLGGSAADHPVSVSISSNATEWSYVKWASGKLECWTKVGFGWSGTHNVNQSWGSFYCSQYEIGADLEYPVSFISTPYVYTNLDNSGNYAGFVIGGYDSAKFPNGNTGDRYYPGGFRVVRPVTGSVNGYINIRAVGRWK